MRIIIYIIIIFLLFHMIGCKKSNTGALLPGSESHLTPFTEFTSIQEFPSENSSTKLKPDYTNLRCPAGLPVFRQTYVIGVSVKGTPIVATKIGTGRKTGLVLVGTIHGNEKNTGTLVSFLKSHYEQNHDLIPSSMRLYFVPVLNPDGLENKTRRNAHNVDLNRNFPTDTWKRDAVSPSKIIPGSGGSSPGSEPEVRAIIDWLSRNVKHTVDSVYLISFHSAYPPEGSVQPGYRVYGKPGPESEKFAQFISQQSGYKYLQTWITSSELTGEFIHWCELNNIWASDIELPDYNPPSTIPDGKKETSSKTFERTIQSFLLNFFIDS